MLIEEKLYLLENSLGDIACVLIFWHCKQFQHVQINSLFLPPQSSRPCFFYKQLPIALQINPASLNKAHTGIKLIFYYCGK